MHTSRRLLRRTGILLVAVAASACSTSEAAGPAPVRRVAADAPPGAASPTALPPPLATYPWPHTDAPHDRLDTRFAAPSGFARVEVSHGSFAAFLRSLPLQPEGAPVIDFRGNKLHADGHHPNIVAVADIDVGTRDLQHCADAIVRLNAEWRYGRGDRDIVYRSVSGQSLAYRSYVEGERARPVGSNLVFERAAAPRTDDHALFRGWLDDVFAWAGTASLERDGARVPALSDVKPGDFFVMSGAPFGHAVLILDVARDDRGRVALLLGQSYMPAQSFQVLAPSRPDGAPWFIIEPGDTSVSTPFWRPFPLTSLRRL